MNLVYQWIRPPLTIIQKMFFASLFFPSKHASSFFDNQNNILAVKKTIKRVTKCLEQTKKARCVEGVAGVVVENL